MFDFIKKLFGNNSTDFQALVKSGAQIVDVRTEAEYDNGHIRNSKNIPLQNLSNAADKLDKSRPVITCCASGMRSASAKTMLEEMGFETYNGGGWKSLQEKLSS